MSVPVLAIENVSVELPGVGRIIDDVSFVLNAGETMALVGESGCGKTMLCRAISGLLPPSIQRRVRGRVLWRGIDLLGLDRAAFAAVRGRNFGYVFQDPLTSLNPVRRIGDQVAERLRVHGGLSRAAARDIALQALDSVGMRDAHLRMRQYPHELSGGMRQRAAIAMAIASRPTLLIADEPTTALDVTVQAGVLALLDRLRLDMEMATLLVTHNLCVVAGSAQRTMVMYAGRIVECGPTEVVLGSPRMPYTKALLAATPRLDGPANLRLAQIEGRPPDLASMQMGCRFAPRCNQTYDQCRRVAPSLREVSPGRQAACWRIDESGGAA